jgi:hypothetical protein
MTSRIILFALGTVLLFRTSPTTAGVCDPVLPVNETDPWAYHERGERCEGRFVNQLGAEALRVVELANKSANYIFASNKPLIVTWPTPVASEIQLRAVSLRKDLYYRMDTIRAADSSNFTWPTDVLCAPPLNLTRKEIAVTEWINHALRNGKDIHLYLPIVVSQASETGNENLASKNEYNLVILPGIQLDQVYFTLQHFDDDAAGTVIKEQEEQNQFFYPAQRPIVFKLSSAERGPSHEYYFAVSARKKEGGSAAIEGLFFFPSNEIKVN